MTNQTLLALGIFAAVIIAFFTVFRGRGKFRMKIPKLGEVSAEGENPPPPAKVAPGVSIEGAEAGKNITAHSASEGGVDMKAVKAGGDIKATHLPGEPPPKP